MGTQTMGSHGSGFGGGRGGQEPKSSALFRQGSLYNLTLDEVQNHLGDLGKPLSSMNLDELLKSIWSVEANQGISGTDYRQITGGIGQLASASSINRRSSLTFTRDFSNKTVDELWQDIKEGNTKDRQSTLGEMTLEDFLVKAGVVDEAGILPQANIPPPLQQPHWMHYQIQPQQQQQNLLTGYIPPGHHPNQQPIPIGGNPMMDSSAASYPENQMAMSPSPMMGTLSDTQQTPGRKRGGEHGVVVEKTVERRQKRMIKNRESAARSRARKQAYTHELENKVSRLEEENERLKRQKEVQKVLPSIPPPERKFQLRRTSSASF